jgi:hypothetical protein
MAASRSVLHLRRQAPQDPEFTGFSITVPYGALS